MCLGAGGGRERMSEGKREGKRKRDVLTSGTPENLQLLGGKIHKKRNPLFLPIFTFSPILVINKHSS